MSDSRADQQLQISYLALAIPRISIDAALLECLESTMAGAARLPIVHTRGEP